MSTLPTLDYAPSLESVEAAGLRRRYGLLIGGKWVAPEKGYVPVIDPATESTVTHVAAAGSTDVVKAVNAAHRGFDKYWRKLPLAERAKYLFRFAAAVDERARALGLAETLETGTPVRRSQQVDASRAASLFFYYAGWSDKLDSSAVNAGRSRPHGVVGAILASDAPLVGAAAVLAPALASGNAVVLKPSRANSLPALFLGQVALDAGLPPGVFNVVSGDAKVGEALAEHAAVDAIAFAGSAANGRAVARAIAGTNKPLQLSLRALSVLIVYEDAPLDQAVEAVAGALAAGALQGPSSGIRLIVQESVYDDVVARIGERVGSLRHGNPLDRNTDVGPIATRARRDALADIATRAEADGAKIVQAPWDPPVAGFWFPASILTRVQPTHMVARETTRGPLLPILSFRTADESLELARSLRCTLAAGVWTSSGQLAMYAAQRLQTGVVWCNAFDRFDPSAPFGGFGNDRRDGGFVGLGGYVQSE